MFQRPSQSVKFSFLGKQASSTSIEDKKIKQPKIAIFSQDNRKSRLRRNVPSMDGSFLIGETKNKFNPSDALKVLTKSFANLMKMEIDDSNKNLKKFKEEEEERIKIV